MTRRLASAVGLVALVALAPTTAAVGSEVTRVTATDLIVESARYDEREVAIRGELVGDFQRRGDVVWVQLNDDAYVDAPLLDGGPAAGTNIGIGIRLPVEVFDALAVSRPGGYRVRGPVVLVTGVWRHHDEARGGESYLDAAGAELVDAERVMTEAFVWWEAAVGGLLLLVAAIPVLRRRGRAA